VFIARKKLELLATTADLPTAPTLAHLFWEKETAHQLCGNTDCPNIQRQLEGRFGPAQNSYVLENIGVLKLDFTGYAPKSNSVLQLRT
jgi:hypothetical protein